VFTLLANVSTMLRDIFPLQKFHMCNAGNFENDFNMQSSDPII